MLTMNHTKHANNEATSSISSSICMYVFLLCAYGQIKWWWWWTCLATRHSSATGSERAIVVIYVHTGRHTLLGNSVFMLSMDSTLQWAGTRSDSDQSIPYRPSLCNDYIT